MKWTDDQRNAIEARAGELLVSAAAGSGKTAVLVERVIRRLTDESNPCGVRELLIVTFTNAAAAQMKEKISSAISKKIVHEPNNKSLRRQQMLLPLASICTIDSFCINLVRENFHTLDVTPDFRLLDNERIAVLAGDAVNSVIGALYEKSEPAFRRLCALISDKRDDKLLMELIQSIYITAQAYPNPDAWLDSLVEDFTDIKPIRESVWGREIISYAAKQLDYCAECNRKALDILAQDIELGAKYTETFENDRGIILRMKKALCESDWDDLAQVFERESKSFTRLNPIRGYTGTNKGLCSACRDTVKKGVSKTAELFAVTQAEYESDTASLREVAAQLVNAVKLYAAEFSALKKADNGADFSDTLHLALKLLLDENGEKTPLAYELSQSYAEILVDEYQDVNEAQDSIFKALSRNESNLFMVGDVKQSIYRFRMAMPEIFLRRRERLPRYSGKAPATVILGKNFRSRSGVTGAVNFIFSQAMSVEAGGLAYDEGERLVCAAEYPESGCADTELHIIEAASGEQKHFQAVYAADYIENAIKSGMLIQDGEERRPAEYKDFCILLRSVSKNAGEFLREFAARSIPVYCETEENFFASPEIGFMLSLLRVLDNPVDDISLLTVMLSPVFGFTPDDLALMRSACKDGAIYHCIVMNANSGNEKCAQFLERLEFLRGIASTVSAGELVRRLIDETGYGAVVGSMKDSDKRKANLRLLVDCANKYEANARTGLSGFVRYADRLSQSGGAMTASTGVSENADAVRITTIHKSKGLEFPVCILACCESSFHPVKAGKVIASRGCGIGMRNCDESGLRKFETLNSVAVRLETLREEHSEEMRVLYVALTRAKEKLILLTASGDVEESLHNASCLITGGEKLNPFGVSQSTSYDNIIFAALMRHPDAHILRTVCGADNSIVLPCDSPLAVKIIKNVRESEITGETVEPQKADKALVREISRRLDYKYPYASLSGVVAKRIASKLNSGEFDSTWFASEIPAFMSRGELTAAQRGTATHRFMQFADYARAAQSVESEIDRLAEIGKLNELEARSVDRKKVRGFFESKLALRLAAAERVYRELAFTVNIPVREMYDGIDDRAADEKVMIEGVADCAFVEGGELVIVDYKTDRGADANQLVERYGDQLRIYRRSLAQVLGLNVKQLLIYSFELEEAIEVE